MMIILKTPEEIEGIRASGRIAARSLAMIEKEIKPGLTTEHLDNLINEFLLDNQAISACKGYRGFPKYTCISINDEVVHGIPGKRRLKEGDLVKVDVTAIYKGFYGDTARSFIVNPAPERAVKLMEATKKSLELAIAEVRPGGRMGDIGAAVQGHVEPLGFSVVRAFVGHGIGRQFHEDLQVPHYGRRGSGIRFKEGMVFTIEPMINEGVWDIKILDDGWTAVTRDGRLSAQFEHTLAVTEHGADILTLP